MPKLNLNKVASDWRPIVKKALQSVNPDYLHYLEITSSWLPGHENIFNAFTLPLSQVKYVLFGESPYPRKASANGFAFWDSAVSELWSGQGFTKTVNRATSLRNLLKMLLLAREDIQPDDLSQAAIAAVNKKFLVKTIEELFVNFMRHGILLLNATLALSQNGVTKDAKYWHNFMEFILQSLCQCRRDIKLILLGKIAKEITSIPAASCFEQLVAEHPYNRSFITNPQILNFFRPLNLLAKHSTYEKLRSC